MRQTNLKKVIKQCLQQKRSIFHRVYTLSQRTEGVEEEYTKRKLSGNNIGHNALLALLFHKSRLILTRI